MSFLAPATQLFSVSPSCTHNCSQAPGWWGLRHRWGCGPVHPSSWLLLPPALQLLDLPQRPLSDFWVARAVSCVVMRRLAPPSQCKSWSWGCHTLEPSRSCQSCLCHQHLLRVRPFQAHRQCCLLNYIPEASRLLPYSLPWSSARPLNRKADTQKDIAKPDPDQHDSQCLLCLHS